MHISNRASSNQIAGSNTPHPFYWPSCATIIASLFFECQTRKTFTRPELQSARLSSCASLFFVQSGDQPTYRGSSDPAQTSYQLTFHTLVSLFGVYAPPADDSPPWRCKRAWNTPSALEPPCRASLLSTARCDIGTTSSRHMPAALAKALSRLTAYMCVRHYAWTLCSLDTMWLERVLVAILSVTAPMRRTPELPGECMQMHTCSALRFRYQVTKPAWAVVTLRITSLMACSGFQGIQQLCIVPGV